MGNSKFSKASNKTLKRNYEVLPARMPGFWSYTRWSTWAVEVGGCPFRYLLQFCHKLEQEKGYALVRGIDIHSKAEAFLKGDIRGLPRELAEFRNELAEIKKLGAISEKSITLTKTFNQTSATDWGKAWLRVKIDAALIDTDAATGTFIDFKTGRNRGGYTEQEEIYALTSFTVFPALKNIDTEYWFLDNGDVVANAFKRADYPALKKKWKGEAAKMLDAKTFKPNPGKACTYCPYRSNVKMPNGEYGPCDKWQKG